jgi:hypothetical protein
MTNTVTTRKIKYGDYVLQEQFTYIFQLLKNTVRNHPDGREIAVYGYYAD